MIIILFKYYKNLKIGKKIPFELSLNRSQYINKNQKVSDQLIADSGYGQGQILMNPLQLASIYSAFVNNGSIYQPHIVQGKTRTWIKNVFSKATTIMTITFTMSLQMKKEQDMPSIVIM